MKAWIVKNALLRYRGGIVEAIVSDPSPEYPDAIHYHGRAYLGEGKEWCRSLEDAEARVTDMKVQEIGALERRIAWLKALKIITISCNKREKGVSRDKASHYAFNKREH